MQGRKRALALMCGAFALAIALIVWPMPAHAASITLVSPENGQSVSIVNAKAESWWSGYKVHGDLRNKKKQDLVKPKPVKLKWKGREGYTYRVYVSLSPTMDDCLKYKTSKQSVKVKRLLRGKTYYWKAVGEKGSKRIKSKVRHFKTKNTVRIVSVSGVSNVRDIGGYKASRGAKVKQGMVYRCASLDKITASGKKVLKRKLQAKTDLDLRCVGEGTAGEGSPALGSYMNCRGAMYDDIFEAGKLRDRFVAEFKVFADAENYPIVMHCTYGRDRTGTLAFVLNAYLGVSKKNLYRDYELTFLTKCGMKHEKSAKERAKRLDALYQKMASYKDPDKSLAYNTKAYLLDAGMTPEELEAIKSILLE